MESASPPPPPPPQSPPPPPPSQGSGRLSTGAIVAIAVGSVLAFAVAIALIVILAGSDSSEVDSRDVADADARSQARTAQTALEVYATDNNGTYTGATPPDLAVIEPGLDGVPLTVDAQETSYSITVESTDTGNSFTVTRNADATTTFTCSELGVGGCPADGDWS